MAVNDIDNEFIEFFQKAVSLQGADSSIGTVLGTLYIEPEEMAMEELARRTGYSLASICNKVKIFEQSGLIRKIRKPHTKKTFLYMDKDMSEIIKKFLLMKQKTVIALAKQKLPALLDKYKNKRMNEKEKKKIEIMDHYYQDVLAFEKMINKMIEKLDELKRVR